MARQVIVVPHDPAWKDAFEEEAGRISETLGGLVVRLHHIGSTAIPGVLAKPIIDMLLEVNDLTALEARSPAMEALGYEALGEFGLPGRRYFRKDNAAGIRTHQVHAFKAEDPEIERHLAFRDYMIAHPAEAGEYGELKQRLAQAHPTDIQAYVDGKDLFIKEHEARALAWRAAGA